MADNNRKYSENAPAPRRDTELLDAVSTMLALNMDSLERIAQAEPRYFEEARQGVLDALRRWDDDHKVPACLACGSPRVDWVEPMALYRCQECGAEENRITHERKATLHAPPSHSTSAGPTARDALVFFAERIDESTTHDRKEQAHG